MTFRQFVVTEGYKSEFLTSILERPDDPASYLIYADWLDDNGEVELGQFIKAVLERKKNPRGRLRELNSVIKRSLPLVYNLAKPYLLGYFSRNDDSISIDAANEDQNYKRYIFYQKPVSSMRMMRSTWGDDWITYSAPAGVLIGEPMQDRIASGDRGAMARLRRQASEWELPYIGNIIHDPPENLLSAMVFANLLHGIPMHVFNLRGTY